MRLGQSTDIRWWDLPTGGSSKEDGGQAQVMELHRGRVLLGMTQTGHSSRTFYDIFIRILSMRGVIHE